MNKPDLKTLLKPLIESTVRKVILEPGVLSKIITEVVSGLQGSLIIESKNSIKKNTEIDEEMEYQRKQYKLEFEQEKQDKARKMIERTGLSKAFANIKTIEPVEHQSTLQIMDKKNITEEEKKIILKEEKEESKFGAHGGLALEGIDPNDPGININGILNIVGGKTTWLKRLGK